MTGNCKHSHQRTMFADRYQGKIAYLVWCQTCLAVDRKFVKEKL